MDKRATQIIALGSLWISILVRPSAGSHDGFSPDASHDTHTTIIVRPSAGSHDGFSPDASHDTHDGHRAMHHWPAVSKFLWIMALNALYNALCIWPSGQLCTSEQ